MFVLFLLGCLVFGCLALALVAFGHWLYVRMCRDEEKFDIEKETYESIKQEIKRRRK